MLRYVVLAAALTGAVHGCTESITVVGGTRAPSTVCSGELVFQDEFDYLDFSTWEHEITIGGDGNWEFQWYTNNRTNSYVNDGILYIVPTLTADDLGEGALSSATLSLYGGSPVETCTNNADYGCERRGTSTNILNPTKSARIRTFNSFHFRYGKVEVRAKLPVGDWLWPAIWMMPRWNVYGWWPASGEIDIAEARANEDYVQSGTQIGIQQYGATMHWGPSSSANQYERTHFTRNNPSGYNSDFHVYGVLWTSDNITFTVDDETVGIVDPGTNFWDYGNLANSNYSNPWGTHSKMAPFDQEFYFILNLAVGGISYFPDDATNPNGKPWLNTSPTALTDFWNGKSSWYPTWSGINSTLQVDYVRIYAI